MENAMLTDAPERDRTEIERYIESHGSAIVLRCNGKIGSDAQAEFIAAKKANGYTDPPHDFVWIGEATLGPISVADIEAAGRELREATAAREEVEREIASLRCGTAGRFYLWWGGAMMGGGAAFALTHRYAPPWIALLVFGAVFSLLGLEGLRRGR